MAVHIPFIYTISESTVRNALCDLNQKFAPIGIQFRISQFYYDGQVISNLTSGEVNGDNYYLAPYTISSFSVVAKTKDEKTETLTEMAGENVEFEAKLYDLNGNVVKEGKSGGKHRIDWNTSDLKEGQYILRTEYKGEVKSQHVMVNSVCCGGGGC